MIHYVYEIQIIHSIPGSILVICVYVYTVFQNNCVLSLAHILLQEIFKVLNAMRVHSHSYRMTFLPSGNDQYHLSSVLAWERYKYFENSWKKNHKFSWIDYKLWYNFLPSVSYSFSLFSYFYSFFFPLYFLTS